MTETYKQIDRAIIKEIADGDKYTVPEISEKLRKYSSQEVRGSLRRLASKGKIEIEMRDDGQPALYNLAPGQAGV